MLARRGNCRMVPANPGHVLEPNVSKWQAAAVWSISLSPGVQPPPSTELRLRLSYIGDAARFITNGSTVLHDNWHTACEDLGRMEAMEAVLH